MVTLHGFTSELEESIITLTKPQSMSLKTNNNYLMEISETNKEEVSMPTEKRFLLLHKKLPSILVNTLIALMSKNIQFQDGSDGANLYQTKTGRLLLDFPCYQKTKLLITLSTVTEHSLSTEDQVSGNSQLTLLTTKKMQLTATLMKIFHLVINLITGLISTTVIPSN